ncbi:MAG: type II toxin-antitoxin system VapC family toxin [Luteolibacter sp.]
MRYLLDTNAIIFALKDAQGRTALRIGQTPHDDMLICAVVETELYHGATKYGLLTRRQAVLGAFLEPFHSLPFDSDCVPHYAAVRDDLERQGRIIGGNDLMIAAIALTHGLTVVTNNCQEFGRVPGLRVEDWSE